MPRTERHILAALLAGLLPLSACQIPPDTGATDPDRFVMETNPVWAQPRDQGREIVVKKTTRTPAFSAILPVFGADEGYPATRPLSDIVTRYNPVDDGGHWLPAIPVDKVPVNMLRQTVSWDWPEAAGTIVVDTAGRHLYFIEGKGRAIRYGIGIGRAGLAFRGEGVVGRMARWPKWTPTPDMTDANPALNPLSAKFGGLVGGTNNPLGARALYIVQDGRETLYRIHGTPDWKSVGKEVSSGCVRMFNQDVIDLYDRVRPGAAIIVR